MRAPQKRQDNLGSKPILFTWKMDMNKGNPSTVCGYRVFRNRSPDRQAPYATASDVGHALSAVVATAGADPLSAHRGGRERVRVGRLCRAKGVLHA